MRTLTIIAIALALLGTPARADHYAGFYVIPVASHVSGAFGTMWMSDVAIQNFQSSPLTVELVFIESGFGNTFNNVFPLESVPNAAMTIPAGGTALLKDVLNNFRGQSSSIGAILAGSSDGRPFAITSRAYVNASGGGTIGQTVTPARDFLENAAGDVNEAIATAYLPGLISNSRFRSNLGFVAGTAGGSALIVDFTWRDAGGATIGTKSFLIGAGELVHAQFPATGSFDAGSAEVRISAGDGAVVPYASIVDNTSGDGVFVLGQFPNNVPFASNVRRSVFEKLFRQK
jgi:hypothetical protein